MSSTATALLATTTATTPEGSAPAPTYADADALVGPVADTTEQNPSTGLAAACAAGTVALYRRRGTGSLRRVPYLAPETTAREIAEWFALRREEGLRVAAIASEAGCSRVTVRRTLVALDLAEALEDGDLDDLYAEDTVALVLAGDQDAA